MSIPTRLVFFSKQTKVETRKPAEPKCCLKWFWKLETKYLPKPKP